jgi:dTDP-4-dehydrorhamnose 3,5-epimerase
MIFRELKLTGAFIIELKKIEDERGFFAQSWSEKEFAAQGLDSHLVECSISFNRKRGTLRGMHYQAAPHGQVKIVRCTKGSIHDVIIDLRAGSPTFKRWESVELSEANHRMLYIPKDFAHGFLTLEDATEVFYQMSDPYAPESGRGVRWDDRAFGISWPAPVSMINERDRSYPDFASS